MLKKNTTELGKTISEAREKLGISQRELSRKANMDCAEVSRIEAGKRLKPNILYLKGIAETLGLSLVKLMKLAGYDDVDIKIYQVKDLQVIIKNKLNLTNNFILMF